MKLSPRLAAALDNALTELPLWDICCDHGLLGIQALKTRQFSQVHFVDQVSHLMISLENKFKIRTKDISRPLAHFYTIPAESLRIKLTGTVCVLGVGAQKIEGFLRSWIEAEILEAQRLILGPHKDESWFMKEVIPSLHPYRLEKQISIQERGRERILFILNRK